MAWSQTHDQPQHNYGADGPFSFCSYPFLLNPRAKSKLLHTEARYIMQQVGRRPPAAALAYMHLASQSKSSLSSKGTGSLSLLVQPSCALMPCLLTSSCSASTILMVCSSPISDNSPAG